MDGKPLDSSCLRFLLYGTFGDPDLPNNFNPKQLLEYWKKAKATLNDSSQIKGKPIIISTTGEINKLGYFEPIYKKKIKD